MLSIKKSVPCFPGKGQKVTAVFTYIRQLAIHFQDPLVLPRFSLFCGRRGPAYFMTNTRFAGRPYLTAGLPFRY